MEDPREAALFDAIRENQEQIKLHMGIAEQGKIYALAGDHEKALFYYRRAVNMTIEAKDPEIFFRHYLECVMESLEWTGAYREVLEYCDKAISFYEDHPPPNEVAILDLANIHQKRGVMLLKLEESSEEAGSAFRQAIEIADSVEQKMPLAENFLRWIDTRMHIDPQRILSEQKRTRYFSIRDELVDPKIAVKLPDEGMAGVGAGV